MEGTVVDHSTDSAGHLLYIVYLQRDEKGKLLHQSRKFPPAYVRRIYASPGSTHKVADGSPTKGAVVSFLATAINALEHGYNCDWPIGIVIWNLHQCTKQAQDLATAMYSCVLQSISDGTPLPSGIIRLNEQKVCDSKGMPRPKPYILEASKLLKG